MENSDEHRKQRLLSSTSDALARSPIIFIRNPNGIVRQVRAINLAEDLALS